ncbi:phosphoglycerate dehydrogenase [Chloroflexota bacterium]
MKVLISDPISEEGIAVLRECAEVDVKTGLKAEEIIPIIGEYDAMIVRSQTKVTADIIKAGKKLQIIARAGVGIDNVDVEAATQHGIVVVNAPTGNTVSAAEHAFALIMALARHIPQANTVLKGGAWKRSDFMGTELRGKTLGVIGLGNVGSEVAKRAWAFEMKVIGFDPFISVDRAKKLQVKLVALEELLQQADFVSLHIPLTDQTRKLIGTKELAIVKPAVRIVNCARGGLIDEGALVKALDEKRVAGVAVDVFEKEPTTESVLFGYDNVIVTPHLGASTEEAQVMAARDVAEQIVDVFNGKPARAALNAPFIPAETLQALAPFLKVANILGNLASQLADGQANAIQIGYEGEIAEYDTNALKAAVLGGLLSQISEERVNLVNANLIAERRGLSVVEQKESACENYVGLITVELTTDKGKTIVSGTAMHGHPHIVRVNDYWFDIEPTGAYFLFSEHRDRPGIIGTVGRITGEADININAMHVSRLKPRGQALMVIAIDEPLPEKQRQQILDIPDILTVKLIKLETV